MRRKRSSSLQKMRDEAVHATKNDFGKSFFRNMDEQDRFFFWTYCYSEKELKNEVIMAMIEAGTREELIFVYDKTGFMVTKESELNLTDEEREEVDAAYEAFVAQSEQGVLYKAEDYIEFDVERDSPFVQNLYIFGNFVERNVNSGSLRLNFRTFLAAYLVVRVYRLVRAIFRIKRFTTSEEQMILVRALYEVYGKLVFSLQGESNARYLLNSDFGLVNGEYEFLVKRGKLNRSKLRNKRSGEIIDRNISMLRMISASPIKSDPQLFSTLYDFQSSFVHSGSRHIDSTWEGQFTGFKLVVEDEEQDSLLASVLTHSISAMIMQILLRIRGISPVSRRDMKFFCKIIKKLNQDMLKDAALNKTSYQYPVLRALRRRTNSLPGIVG